MDIANRVAKVIIEQLGLTAESVTPEKKIIDDLGADSLDQLEIVMGIEDEFAFEISDDDAEKFKTVQQVIDFVTKHKDSA